MSTEQIKDRDAIFSFVHRYSLLKSEADRKRFMHEFQRAQDIISQVPLVDSNELEGLKQRAQKAVDNINTMIAYLECPECDVFTTEEADKIIPPNPNTKSSN